MAGEDNDPYERLYHQLIHDIRELEEDAAKIENVEVLVFIRSLLEKKRETIMRVYSQYVAPLGEK